MLWGAIKNEKGMSLIEVMVTAATFAIIVVAMGNTMMSLYQHEATVTKKDMGNEFAADFSRVFTDTETCSSYLGGVVLASSGAARNLTFQDFLGHKRDDALVTPSSDDLAEGADIYDGLKCTGLDVRNSSLPDQPKVVDGNNRVVRVAEIELRLSIVQTNGERELKPRRFRVPVLVDPATNRITKCDTEIGFEDSCQSIGGNWDSAAGTCNPSTNCFIQGTYMTSVCNPTSTGCVDPQINHITRGLSCPSPSVATRTGQFRNVFTESCGKKCTRTITNDMAYYVCMFCN